MIKERLLTVARPEFAQATEELKAMTPQEAVMRFYARQDARIDQAIAASDETLACRAGCSYCCNHKVEARAIEVLEIRAHVTRHFSPDQLRQLMERVKRNADQAKDMSYDEQLATNQPCAFLVDNQCSVYTVRPTNCRNFHATKLENCERSYAEPTNMDIENSFIDGLYISANGGSAGFDNALAYAGLDNRSYDLSTAFLEAMKSPTAVARFKSGKKTFVKAKVKEKTEASAAAKA